ncbi:MAG TPA: DNA translocase FtsK [Acetivibrio sp.]|uniref:DNA translocase FtsK n=1 Tax=Acetivibrio sp. TaxID=1872092 RepID=UPI002BBCC376|nr:DNA translocase FtsK [Acetivibrio sp.]HOM02171.1 DNA translocase FtsK [Acetivibrio sp.]
MTSSMGTLRVGKSGYAKKMKKNRRKRSFIIIAAFMALIGLVFAKGSIGQFFKVFAIEAAFVTGVLCLLAVYRNRNRKKPKTATRIKAHDSSYNRADSNRSIKRNEDFDSYNLRTRKNNFNWIVDENVAGGSGSSLSEGKQVSTEKIKLGEDRMGSSEADIKARVANWVENVDYSGNVFRRIIESQMKSIKELENPENIRQNLFVEPKSMSDGAEFEEAHEAEYIYKDERMNNTDNIVSEVSAIEAEKTEELYKREDLYKGIRNAENEATIMEYSDDDPEETEITADFMEFEDMKDNIVEAVSIGDFEELIEFEDMDKYAQNNAKRVEYVEEPAGFEEVIEGMKDGMDEAEEDIREFAQFKDTYEEDTYEMKELQYIGDESGCNEFEKIGQAEQNRYPSREMEPVFPPMELLKQAESKNGSYESKYNSEIRAKKLIDTLESFGVRAKIINISEGPSVTRYELQPDYGVKVSKIVSLTDDIALNLAAVGVRIEAPIPGKAAIGIEIPNEKVTPVLLREVIESDEFQNHPSKLSFAVGKDIAGKPVVADIAQMPHLLIAGATGSGKSVCINTLITSILYKASPKDVRLLMVDPKVVELSIYNGIPHLLIPVVTDPKKAAGALNWAVQEMTNRYKLFAENSVRDLEGYNHMMIREGGQTLPQIVIIIDELADLMMVAPNDVEDCICRLAQMARAAGMYLVIATQRPSVNVITGVIKANVPSRISFAVSSQIDSRTILDMSGAEKLLGKGDMLFYPRGIPKPVRVQGALITDTEVESIVSFMKSTQQAQYDDEVINKIDSHADETQPFSEEDDELLPQVIDMIIEYEQASTSLIQRKFKIGYSRAARIMDQLEANGVIGPFEGSKPRKVLITKQQWQEMSS